MNFQLARSWCDKAPCSFTSSPRIQPDGLLVRDERNALNIDILLCVEQTLTTNFLINLSESARELAKELSYSSEITG